MNILKPLLPTDLRTAWTLSESLERYQREEELVENSLFLQEKWPIRHYTPIPVQTCLFRKCDFSLSQLHKASFRHVVFEHCDFSNVMWTECRFERVEFRLCKLMGSVFSAALWRHVLFEEISGEYCSFSGGDFDRTQFKQCSVTNSSLSDCKWKQVQFDKTDFSSCEFLHTSLKGVDLRDCQLNGIRLAGPELRGAMVTSLQAVELSRFLGLEINDDPIICKVRHDFRSGNLS